MADIEQRDRTRLRVLEALYDLTGGVAGEHIVPNEELQRAAGVAELREFDAAFGWLSDRRLARLMTFGGVDITPAGVV